MAGTRTKSVRRFGLILGAVIGLGLSGYGITTVASDVSAQTGGTPTSTALASPTAPRSGNAPAGLDSGASDPGLAIAVAGVIVVGAGALLALESRRRTG